MHDRGERQPARRTLRGLDWLNFFLADVQTGVGPFLAIYLAKQGWNEELVGTALSVGGIAGIIAQTPAGALVDAARSKRALVAAGILALGFGAFVIAIFPRLYPVLMAQVLIGASSSIIRPSIPRAM
jgi:MFS family permease